MHRPTPLAHGTMPHATEPRVCQLQFPSRVGGRRAGKLQHLGAHLNPCGIAPVSGERTVREDVLDFVRLCAVYIPRFVLWRKVRQVLLAVDQALSTEYSERVFIRPDRHTEPPVLVNSLAPATLSGVPCFSNPSVCSKSLIFLIILQISVAKFQRLFSLLTGNPRQSYPLGFEERSDMRGSVSDFSSLTVTSQRVTFVRDNENNSCALP